MSKNKTIEINENQVRSEKEIITNVSSKGNIQMRNAVT